MMKKVDKICISITADIPLRISNIKSISYLSILNCPVLAANSRGYRRRLGNLTLPQQLPGLSQSLQHADYPAPSQRSIHLDSRALPGTIIDNRQGAKATPGDDTISDKVHRPALVAPFAIIARANGSGSVTSGGAGVSKGSTGKDFDLTFDLTV